LLAGTVNFSVVRLRASRSQSQREGRLFVIVIEHALDLLGSAIDLVLDGSLSLKSLTHKLIYPDYVGVGGVDA
jgi:hypothetical protein